MIYVSALGCSPLCVENLDQKQKTMRLSLQSFIESEIRYFIIVVLNHNCPTALE